MTPRLKMDWNSRVLVCKKCDVCVIRFQWVEGYDVIVKWEGGLESLERYWYVICPSCWDFPTMMVPAEFVNQEIRGE